MITIRVFVEYEIVYESIWEKNIVQFTHKLRSANIPYKKESDDISTVIKVRKYHLTETKKILMN